MQETNTMCLDWHFAQISRASSIFHTQKPAFQSKGKSNETLIFPEVAASLERERERKKSSGILKFPLGFFPKKLYSSLHRYIYMMDSTISCFWVEMVFRRVAICFLGCLGISHPAKKAAPALAPAPPETTETSSSSSSSSSSLASSDGTPSRVRLSDGRCLAYRELGVPKNISNYKVILVHGFGSSKEMSFMASQVLSKTLLLNFISFFE